MPGIRLDSCQFVERIASVSAATRLRRPLLLRHRLHPRFTPIFQQRAALLAEISAAARSRIRHSVTDKALPEDYVVLRRVNLIGLREVEAHGLRCPISRVMPCVLRAGRYGSARDGATRS